jgi:hypothetical protein
MKALSFVRAAVVLVAASAASALAAPAALAQGAGDLRGPFIGVGAGMGSVRDQNLDEQRVGAMLHARAGWGLGHGIAPMLELGVHGLGDDQPRNGDVVIINPSGGGQTTQVVRSPSVLNTVSLLASVQVGLPRAFYVRPGLGVASHAFAVYNLFGTDTPTAETSHEAGPAAGFALGRTMNLAGRFPVAVEGVALWTGGEDSTGSRWAAGVQVVPMIRF